MFIIIKIIKHNNIGINTKSMNSSQFFDAFLALIRNSAHNVCRLRNN